MATWTNFNNGETGANVRTLINKLGTDDSLAFRFASELAEIGNEIQYWETGTIVYAVAEGKFYQYGGATWDELQIIGFHDLHNVVFNSLADGDMILYDLASGNWINITSPYAEIYVADGATPQSIPNGASYTKMTGFASNGESGGGASADAANDKISLPLAGRYLVNGSFLFSTGTANINVEGAIFAGGVEVGKIHWKRKIGVSGDIGSASFSGFLDIAGVTDVDVRLKHSGVASVDVTMEFANLSIHYLGR